jgi:hypothetical protein
MRVAPVVPGTRPERATQGDRIPAQRDGATTDMLLVRCRLAQPAGLAEAARRFCEQAPANLRLELAAWSPDAQGAYVYGQLAAPLSLGGDAVARLVQLWTASCPAATGVDVSRLQLAQDLAGASHGAAPTRHYVVETDPETGWEEDIARWYRQEHLPGLAAVPGTIRARRFANHDSGPRSHACYALAGEDTLGCPAWLAVRGTAWSSRVRPHFTNTRRTMMQFEAGGSR